MTMLEKEHWLKVIELEASHISNRIAKTEKELARARLWYEVYMRQVDRLEKRLKRQNAELRRNHRNAEIVANDVDEYDEFYLLANEMTA